MMYGIGQRRVMEGMTLCYGGAMGQVLCNAFHICSACCAFFMQFFE